MRIWARAPIMSNAAELFSLLTRVIPLKFATPADLQINFTRLGYPCGPCGLCCTRKFHGR